MCNRLDCAACNNNHISRQMTPLEEESPCTKGGFALNRNPALFLFVYHFLPENGTLQSRNIHHIKIKNGRHKRPRRQCSDLCHPSLSNCMEYI